MEAAPLGWLVVWSLAVWEGLLIWRKAGHPLIVWLRTRLSDGDGFVGRLSRCGFCLAPYVALLVVAATWEALRGLAPGDWRRSSIEVLVFAAATARLANLFHDIAKTAGVDRTPDYNDQTADEMAARLAAELAAAEESPLESGPEPPASPGSRAA
jgi:hypothetical protein